ncbi:MAG: hypothetical protein JSV90_07735 [Methanobacteriota archaeon]|nr:MAG: hypothetical protein JSV90_07735 [Euryarchaeota archaeon]
MAAKDQRKLDELKRDFEKVEQETARMCQQAIVDLDKKWENAKRDLRKMKR